MKLFSRAEPPPCFTDGCRQWQQYFSLHCRIICSVKWFKKKNNIPLTVARCKNWTENESKNNQSPTETFRNPGKLLLNTRLKMTRKSDLLEEKYKELRVASRLFPQQCIWPNKTEIQNKPTQLLSNCQTGCSLDCTSMLFFVLFRAMMVGALSTLFIFWGKNMCQSHFGQNACTR